MQSSSQKPSLKFTFKLEKRDKDATDSSSLDHVNSTPNQPIAIPSSSPSSSSSYSEESQSNRTGIEDGECTNTCNQLVLYDPAVNGSSEVEHVPDPEPIRCRRSLFGRRSSQKVPPRVLPSVGAFTVQCANCFKWRLIPTKNQYEKIRENIIEQPFYCETAREWRPDISCDDPEDISQDGSRLWAIDKPNIAKPPSGWERLLRIRGEGSTKFADVYYVAPSGKRLRSMVEVQKYILEHPEDIPDGVTLSQFSFQTPKPLQENYVRKRPREPKLSQDANRLAEPTKVPLLPWTGPNYCTDLQLGTPTIPHPPPTTPPACFEASALHSIGQPAKKQVRRAPLN